MRDLWRGIAIAGIWIGVGMVGFSDPAAGVATSFFAVWATLFVSE